MAHLRRRHSCGVEKGVKRSRWHLGLHSSRATAGAKAADGHMFNGHRIDEPPTAVSLALVDVGAVPREGPERQSRAAG
jgi:hypothetical protein